MTVGSGIMAAATSGSGSSSVRKRRVEGSRAEKKAADSSEEQGAESSSSKTEPVKTTSPEALHNGTFWLTRIVLLRSVAFIYCKHVDI